MAQEVLYFSAAWCNPCRAIKPAIEELKQEHPEVTFHSLDIDEEAEAAGNFQVRSIPTLVRLEDGKEVARIVGAHSKQILAEGLNL